MLLPQVPRPELLKAQLLHISAAAGAAAAAGLVEHSGIVGVHRLTGLAPAGLLLRGRRRLRGSTWHLRLQPAKKVPHNRPRVYTCYDVLASRMAVLAAGCGHQISMLAACFERLRAGRGVQQAHSAQLQRVLLQGALQVGTAGQPPPQRLLL
jgi:hypothetical protein